MLIRASSDTRPSLRYGHAARDKALNQQEKFMSPDSKLIAAAILAASYNKGSPNLTFKQMQETFSACLHVVGDGHIHFLDSLKKPIS